MFSEKKFDLFTFFEPIALYFLIFLPGIISQMKSSIIVNFDSITLFENYLIKFFPCFFIIIYIIKLKDNYSFSEFGYKLPSFKSFITLFFFSIFILFAFQISTSFLYFIATKNIINSATSTFLISNKIMLIPTFFIFLMVGYLEEGFFRSYLLTYFDKNGVTKIFAILISSFLFSVGHIYQGRFVTVVIFGIGIILSLLWYKCKNLHTIAITHAGFNFIQISLMLLLK